jgi:hypothetical protein
LATLAAFFVTSASSRAQVTLGDGVAGTCVRADRLAQRSLVGGRYRASAMIVRGKDNVLVEIGQVEDVRARFTYRAGGRSMTACSGSRKGRTWRHQLAPGFVEASRGVSHGEGQMFGRSAGG